MKCKAAILALAALLSVAALAAEAPQGGAQKDKKPDARVGATLDRLGIKYTINSSGNYAVTYGLEGDRSQTVYVMSSTDEYNDVEIREIWSNAGSFDAEPDSAELLDLMTESGKNKIGCWALEAMDDGKYLLFYSIKFPAAASDDAYRAMLEFASSVADEREKDLFASDEN
jgi:hypothetical protein